MGLTEIGTSEERAMEKPATPAGKLRDLTGSGENGAALLDAVSYSLDLLEHEAKEQTKVLLLVSEQRDHGSIVTVDQLVKRVTLSTTLIYSVSFSPVRAEAIRDLKEGNPEPSAGVDLLRIIKLASDAMHKNAASAAIRKVLAAFHGLSSVPIAHECLGQSFHLGTGDFGGCGWLRSLREKE